jgi:hypothetical protein
MVSDTGAGLLWKPELRIAAAAIFPRRPSAYSSLVDGRSTTRRQREPTMFKRIVIIAATVLSSVGAFAQDRPSTEAALVVSRHDVRVDLDQARTAGAWPVLESNDVQRHVVAQDSHKAKRRPRKEYPNVMGMSIDEWLDMREAIAAAAAEPAMASGRAQ